MIYAVAISVFALSWILPWWGFCAVCFLFGHKMKSAVSSFFNAFGAVFILWTIFAYIQNIRSHGLMAEKMSNLFGLPHPMLMIVVSAFLGGLLGGAWSLSGYYLHKLRKKPVAL